MSNTVKASSRSHYGMSVAAAVIYAVAWLVLGRANAAVAVETSIETPMLAAVVVTASKSADTATLEPIVVLAQREIAIESYATLAPIYVEASRSAANATSAQSPSTFANTTIAAGNTQHVVKPGLVTRVGRWLTASLTK